MRISKVHHVTASCIALLAVCLIVATAAGSILLATIPPYNSNAPGAASRPEKKSVDSEKDGKYALLCGIVGGRVENGTIKPFPITPPRAKDDNERVGGCILLDNSKTGPSKRVSGELEASKLILKVDPVFPDSAIKERVGVRVMLIINLNEQGVVTDAEVIKSQTVPPDRDSAGNWVGGVRAAVIKDINAAAVNAVKQWKYSPTLLNGRAIPVTASVSVTFTFNKDRSPRIITFIG